MSGVVCPECEYRYDVVPADPTAHIQLLRIHRYRAHGLTTSMQGDRDAQKAPDRPAGAQETAREDPSVGPDQIPPDVRVVIDREGRTWRRRDSEDDAWEANGFVFYEHQLIAARGPLEAEEPA